MHRRTGVILDVFAGPGGWDEGLALLGQRQVVGIEWDADACATATAAGHARIRADVEHFALDHLRGRIEGLIMSPPCTDWSTAGKQTRWAGSSGRLVMQVPRWIEQLEPRWVACEQVPPALEAWNLFRPGLEARGYRTWAGVLNAADYGVPQTRRRAFLLAALDSQPQPPAPTHARDPEPDLFGPALAPWVSMADALGWSDGRVGFPRRDDLGTSPDGYRERDWRSTSEPAFIVTEKARSWVVNTGRDWKPGGTRDDAQQVPMCGRPGTKVNAADRAGTEAIRITIEDALVLQSFPRDYPVQGNRTSQFRQVGNAVPPRLAAAVLEQFVSGTRDA